MFRGKWAGIIFTVCVIVGSVNFSFGQDEKTALIESVLKLSGVGEQIDLIQQNVVDEINRLEPVDDQGMMGEFSQITREAYRPEKLRQRITDHLNQNFDEVRLKAIEEWLKSPLAVKMIGLELKAASPESNAAVEEFLKEKETKPIPENRLGLAKHLDQALNASDVSLKLASATSQGMIQALEATVPPEERDTLGSAEQEQMIKEMEEPLKEMTLNSLLFTYKDVTDEELQQYIDFYETENGKWFIQLLNDSIVNAMQESSKEIGKEMAKVMAKMPKKTQEETKDLGVPESPKEQLPVE